MIRRVGFISTYLELSQVGFDKTTQLQPSAFAAPFALPGESPTCGHSKLQCCEYTACCPAILLFRIFKLSPRQSLRQSYACCLLCYGIKAKVIGSIVPTKSTVAVIA